MTNNLYVYFRASDAGNPLGRTELSGTYLASVNRRKCFNNFLEAFGTENLTVIADNAKDETINFIKSKGLINIDITNLGNTCGFIYLINKILSERNDEDYVYICEDDYLHLKDAKEYVLEGVSLGEYSSAYDSADKYRNTSDGGYNPLIEKGGEITRVILGKKCHYKETNATTGTFAFKVKTLREDYDVIMKYCQPHFPHPYDFAMFQELRIQRNRRIMVPLPGHSFHVGLEPSPFVPWEDIVKNLKDD
jgi:hypothetical protein